LSALLLFLPLLASLLFQKNLLLALPLYPLAPLFCVGEHSPPLLLLG